MGKLKDAAWAALDVASELYAERLRKLEAKADLRDCESTLEGEVLRAESDAIAAAGGEKGLGPNAEAQKRALALHVRTCDAVKVAEWCLETARMAFGKAEARESYLEAVYRVMLEGIPTGLVIGQDRLDQIIYRPFGRPSAAPDPDLTDAPL